MQSKRSRKSSGLRWAFHANLGAAIIVAAFAAAVVLQTHRTLVRDTADQAALDAASWAAMLLSRPTIAENIFRQSSLSPADEMRLSHATEVKRFNFYEIFDHRGILRRRFERAGVGPARTLSERIRDVRRAIDEKTLVRRAATRLGPDGRERHIKLIYMPIGGPDGIAGVIVAEVETDAAFRAIERRIVAIVTPVLAITALALVGMFVTGVLLLRLRTSAARIEHLALHDPLTGAPNRAGFLDRVTRRVAADQSAGALTALHLVDIDRFKAINDTRGHAAGDAVLRAVVDRLREAAGPSDFFARLGGDEFAFVQGCVPSEAEVKTKADAIVDAVAAIAAVDSGPIRVTASVGAATTGQVSDVIALQKSADAALYEAKERGRNGAVLFSDGMDNKIERRNKVEALLRAAIDHQSFEIYYQSLHRGDGSLFGFEALLRLPDGEGGMVSPGEFIPVVEEMMLARKMGRFVLSNACVEAARWPGQMLVAVNLSPQQFRPELVEEVAFALQVSGLPGRRLGLEVTESLFIDDPEGVAQTLIALKRLGVRIAMDDFGTGFSSLSNLWRFPFDTVKVDRSCMVDATDSPDVQEVLRTIIAMGRTMQLTVVAEGIETEAQRAFAEASGFDFLQGYHFSRPMPGSDVPPFIRRHVADDTVIAFPGVSTQRGATAGPDPAAA